MLWLLWLPLAAGAVQPAAEVARLALRCADQANLPIESQKAELSVHIDNNLLFSGTALLLQPKSVSILYLDTSKGIARSHSTITLNHFEKMLTTLNNSDNNN